MGHTGKINLESLIFSKEEQGIQFCFRWLKWPNKSHSSFYLRLSECSLSLVMYHLDLGALCVLKFQTLMFIFFAIVFSMPHAIGFKLKD